MIAFYRIAAFALAGGLACASQAEQPAGELPASIPSFGEVVTMELNQANGTVHQGNMTGKKTPPAWMIEYPLTDEEGAALVLETDTKIYLYDLEYKPGTDALTPVSNWKIHGQTGCDDWRMKPGRHRCELGEKRLFGTKFSDEDGMRRLLFVIADDSPRATIKMGLYRGVASNGVKMMRRFDALLPDGRQVTPTELLSELDKPGRLLVRGDPADSHAGFLPRGEKAFFHGLQPSPASTAYAASKPPSLRPFFEALYEGGENNAVLNYQKLGLAAIEAGEWSVAESAFDAALTRIETIFSEDAAAAGARSNWENETFKDYKGEPYERAMAYYYRGLLYLREGDFENASASFRAGEYQDTMSSEAQHRSDFGVLSYLAGWAARCNGDESVAADQFDAARDAGFTVPATGDRTLVLAESGRAPIKQRFGIRQQFLTYSVPFSTDDTLVPEVRLADDAIELDTSTSIFLQAATRGQRGMDAILAGKVRHGKSIDLTVQLAGFIPLLGPLAVLATNSHVYKKIGELGTRADVRAWDSLPHRVHAGSLTGSPDDIGAVTYAGNPGMMRFTARHETCSIIWSRQHSAIAEGAGVSGDDPEVDEARAAIAELAARDQALRDTLTGADVGS